MAALSTLLLLGLLLTAPPALGQGPGQQRRPAPAQSPLEKVAAQEELSLPQLAGRWFLVSVASHCSYLAEHSYQLEATTVTVTILDGQSLAISTFRKLDGMCWEIRQRYLPTQARGRFLLKGRGYGRKVDVVVGETDYSTYAILYYQKGRSISVKLYGRTSRVSDDVTDKFEQRVRAVGLNEDVTYYFPQYGFCDSADEFHILDGELWVPGNVLGPPCAKPGRTTGTTLHSCGLGTLGQTHTTPWPCGTAPGGLLWHGEPMPDHPPGQGPSIPLCGGRRWQTITQNGHQMPPGKGKPRLPPTWVRLGLVGSILVFPGVGAGLGWGVLGQGHPRVRTGHPSDSSTTCHWCLGRQRWIPSPGAGLGHLPSPSALLFPFQKQNRKCRRSPELSPCLIQPPMATQDQAGVWEDPAAAPQPWSQPWGSPAPPAVLAAMPVLVLSPHGFVSPLCSAPRCPAAASNAPINASEESVSRHVTP
ncbi:complement component C8 gamma chain isoform 2-T2 [Alca torda]